MTGSAHAPAPCAPSRLSRGPVVLGASVAALLGYAAAAWFAREATYAERVEEQQYGAGTGVPLPRRSTAAPPAATATLLD